MAAAQPYFRTQKAVLECDKIEPNSKSLLAWHPHGILCIGWILNGNVGSELFTSAFRWLTAEILFKLPLISEMLTWYHCAPVSSRAMKARMRRGENLALIPGGFQEATIYEYSKHRVYVKRRKVPPSASLSITRAHSLLSTIAAPLCVLNIRGS